jgi:hypothetical protein
MVWGAKKEPPKNSIIKRLNYSAKQGAKEEPCCES